MIEGLIKAGHEQSDTELTLLTKNVLTSTFSIDDTIDHNKHGKHLVVDANLWGLQYIESGMQCKEADLKMWLSICYDHYKIVWFNTFKSAGLPLFALDGVQFRYEENSQAKVVNMSSRRDETDAFIKERLEHLDKNMKEDLRQISEKKHRSSKHRSSRRY